MVNIRIFQNGLHLNREETVEANKVFFVFPYLGNSGRCGLRSKGKKKTLVSDFF